MIRRHLNNGRIRVLVGLILLVGLLFQCQRALESYSGQAASPVAHVGPVKPNPSAALAAFIPETPDAVPTLETLAARDPMAFFESCLERYDRSVRDYTCTFTKQEKVGRRMTKRQVMKARFREKPFSVRLDWIENADKCDSVLYVKDRWVKNGKQTAVVVPGRIARLFVSHVMRQIDGKDAKKTSRRTLGDFGLRNSLLLTLKYCKLAAEQGILDFRYVGNGEVDHRETLVFERRLPFTGDQTVWPDGLLVVHVDKELQLPTLCQAYTDDGKKQLLGSYMNTDIRLNANLPDKVFTKKGLGI